MKIARGPNGEVVKLEHDENGRVVKRTVERNGFRPKTWTFRLNAPDQMVGCVTPEGEKWTYKYDPFGRRVAKFCARTRTEFVWDGDVIALEITDGVETEWLFEPDTFRPIAKRSNGKVRYIINDHLGTPKEMVTEAGQLVWAADHDTWGTVRKVRSGFTADEPEIKAIGISDFNQNVALKYESSAEIYECPIRFQGQWEDAETEIYYNRARFFDPFTTAYTSSDPIGMLGGLRNNHYIANPNKYTDPFGLRAWSPMGSGICIVQKFPAGSEAAEELANFVGMWNNEIIARGGRMTAGPLTELQESISARWKRDFRRNNCCGVGQVAGHVPDAAAGGLPNPSNGGLLQRSDTNSYLGGITGDMARKRQSYTWVWLRDEC